MDHRIEERSDGIVLPAYPVLRHSVLRGRSRSRLGHRRNRTRRGARGYDRAARGQSSYFVWLNRGKESVVLDIKDPADHDLLARLIARADVLVQNLMPGTMARAGFALEELRERYPRLVICSISGYGETGPYRDMKSYDMLIQAETGLASLTGPAEAPGRVGASVTDIAAGLNAYAAILEALIARQRTGAGALIRVSLFDATAEWMAVPLIHLDHVGRW